MPDFDYTKMSKYAVDLKNAKENSNGQIDINTVLKYGFFKEEKKWKEIPEDIYFTTEFKNFIKENFEEQPEIIDDDGYTHIYVIKLNI